tara:strand:- start:58 stop:183 length:126 start_codon:yes stop_codon:yes gene_type:complete
LAAADGNDAQAGCAGRLLLRMVRVTVRVRIRVRARIKVRVS